jgi:hypothetical protein
MTTTDPLRELLERANPPVVERGDWPDVLVRAEARTRRRPRAAPLVLATALAVAVAAPAIGFGGRLASLLSRDEPARPFRLPRAADTSRIAVLIDVPTGRVLLKAAPMRGVDGVCAVFLGGDGACARRSRGGFLVAFGRPAGFTFDRRAASAEALTRGGRVPLRFARFGGRIDAAFFVARRPLSGFRAVLVRDRAGTVVRRIRALRSPRPR